MKKKRPFDLSKRILTQGITFVLGGARSGKSKFAEDLVLSSGLKPVYLATARTKDEEMSERIAIHQERRGNEWITIEEPLALADAINNEAHEGRVILVDCLTLWVTNLMMEEADVVRECQSLCEALKQSSAPIVLVSNETGLGIIPDNKMAREFGDLAGEVNQKIASVADEVFFIAAGLPLVLKTSS